ncbi:SDR family NAD(P)-dependent oxidoreductase [Rhodococcus aetherivorans]|uniref:SDR family NAD(P)-dependent oxidoreductase n=1 Tax=Rhodococcus aetherivorans TaxID=191292 RepID=UPI00366CE17E
MGSRIAEMRRWRAGTVVHQRLHDLTGTLAVVTGAGSGIGRATARAFSDVGAIVVVADRNLDTARETAEMLNTPDPQAGGSRAVYGGGAHAYELDVADEEQVRRFAATGRSQHGVPDVLVNNAGIAVIGTFTGTPQETFEHVMDVNFWGVVYGCRAFGDQMLERGTGGHIVNVASAAAFTPQKSLVAYSTSKAAVLMFTDCLRAELMGHGIGVSAICPGLVGTNLVPSAEMVGLGVREQRKLRERVTALYRTRSYPPQKVGEAIVAAVRHNRALVTVMPEAKARQWISRLAPPAMRFGARFEPDR